MNIQGDEMIQARRPYVVFIIKEEKITKLW